MFILLYNFDKKISIYTLLSLLFIVLTFSGSGYVMLTLVIIVLLRSAKLSYNSLLGFALIIILLITISILLAQIDAFQSLIVKRLGSVQEGRDNSSKLRFLAPFEVMYFTLKSSPIFGFGFGNLANTLSRNSSSFQYQRIFDGAFTEKVNNIYAIICGSGGITFLLYHFYYLYKNVYSRIISGNSALFIMLLIYPFFSGHFVHIFYWYLIYLIRHIYLATHTKINNNEEEACYC
ncbi:O-antigen ligase family protein [Fulvivirga ligni]|uniref:O-antigen ligase family protein n=1 Tax=Fulvivirga ligni TaxID=2904246 RepID=UPI00351EA3D4